MKFVVKKDVFNEVEVKLHWETKNKIKQVLGWGAMLAGTYFGSKAYLEHQNNKPAE